jgi:hypothetical protein
VREGVRLKRRRGGERGRLVLLLLLMRMEMRGKEDCGVCGLGME